MNLHPEQIAPETIGEIDDMLNDIYLPDQPGAAVIVVKAGQVVFRQGYGMANLELGVKIEPHMVFRLGSITKQFTAVCILMLSEQGKLDLQDDLTRFLPDFPTGGRRVTVEHLLTHTSGIKSYTDMPEWLPLWRKDLSLEELIHIFKDQPFDFEPGEQFHYNNSGYILLGAIIEKLSGLKYADFVQKNIFDRLGMAHSLYDEPERLVPGRVAGYSAGKDGPVNAAYLSMTQPYAAGSLASSVDDLARWTAALSAGSLLSPETLEKAFQPYPLANGERTGYGYGWAIYLHDGLRLIEHGGGINGFTTGGAWAPAEGVYAAVLTNSDSPKVDPSMVAFKLAALACGRPYREPTPIALAEEALPGYVGVYQVNDKEDRVITCQGVQLFIQRTGSKRAELIPIAADTFLLKESADRFIFTRGEEGEIAGLKVVRRFGPAEFSPRTDKPLPGARPSVPLSPTELARFLGVYELAPGFNIEITLTDGDLFVQATGQEKLKLLAASVDSLFAQEIDLLFAFQFDQVGRVSSCQFTQGAQSFPLKKIA